jgi:Aerotolerance regulator N-terminal/von Willebrand factor type A domain
MHLFFQYPALLGLLALAALPVLVHLISRARPPSYRFPNVEFLRRVLRRTARVQRPKDRILLILRTLALLALAAAFAAPLVMSGGSSLPGGKSTVIVLVDRSASMAAREGAGSRFETACTLAASFLQESKPSAANLIWIDAGPDAVFPEPGPNLDFLTEELKKAEPRPEPGAIEAAFDSAIRQLANASGRRELVVLSDFQASAWKNLSPRLPAGVVLHTKRVATGAPPNVAVINLIPQPAEPVVGQELVLLARVRNFSPDPVRTRLTLDAAGSLQTQDVNLPAWGEADSVFTLRPATAGSLPVTASTASDAFPADDSRHALVVVRDSLRVSVETPANSPEARVLTKAAEALPWLEIADPASGGLPDIRFISPWDGSNADQLIQSASSGTTVIVRPAPSCPAAALAKLTGIPAGNIQLSLDARPDGWSVVPEESHPAIRIFRNGDFGNPFAGTVRERVKMPSHLTDAGGVRNIARFADGTPAIFECGGEKARILVWNLTLDPAKSTWPSQGVFLPALAEILMRTRPEGAAGSKQILPGDFVSRISTDPAHAGAVTLLDPDRKTVETTESQTATGTQWQSATAAIPGVFSWQISGQTIDHSVVNFPDSESDLRPMDGSPAFGSLKSAPDSLLRKAALAQGIPLWHWLVLAALIFLAMESLIHGWQRIRKTAPES